MQGECECSIVGFERVSTRTADGAEVACSDPAIPGLVQARFHQHSTQLAGTKDTLWSDGRSVIRARYGLVDDLGWRSETDLNLVALDLNNKRNNQKHRLSPVKAINRYEKHNLFSLKQDSCQFQKHEIRKSQLMSWAKLMAPARSERRQFRLSVSAVSRVRLCQNGSGFHSSFGSIACIISAMAWAFSSLRCCKARMTFLRRSTG